jgi:hypothetical protein
MTLACRTNVNLVAALDALHVLMCHELHRRTIISFLMYAQENCQLSGSNICISVYKWSESEWIRRMPQDNLALAREVAFKIKQCLEPSNRHVQGSVHLLAVQWPPPLD